MFTPNDIIKVFRPSAPMEEADYFIGRKEQKVELERCLYAPGRHAIVYGPRGVGKSSLIKIVENSLPKNCAHVYFRCSSNTSHIDFAQKLLTCCGAMNYESEKKQLTSRNFNAKVKIPIAEGGATSNVQEEVTLKPILENSITPDFLASAITKKSIFLLMNSILLNQRKQNNLHQN